MLVYQVADIELAGKTLVVPIVSTANVSQLAADLLIATLSLRRVTIFDPSFFVPMVGAREDNEHGISTPFELYGRKDMDLLVIQQRSPVLKSRKQLFVDTFLKFVETSKFASLLLLSGIDLSSRTDSQMLTPTYYLHPPRSPPLTPSPLNQIVSLPIPLYTSPVVPSYREKEDDYDVPFLPGGGLTRRILSSLPVNWVIPTASLLQFVLEGDNSADAAMLAAAVVKVLSLDSSIKEWKQPSSWKEGFFGAPHDQTLYG